MENLLVKDFAAVLGVTDRAIYKQIERHKDELEGKIVKKPKQTWLTPEAQDIIRSYTVQPPTVVLESETLAELKQLRQENHDLQSKLAAELERSRTTALRIAELSKSAGLLEAAQQQKSDLVSQLAREKSEHIRREKELQTGLDAAVERAARAEAERDAARERAKLLPVLAIVAAVLLVAVVVVAVL